MVVLIMDTEAQRVQPLEEDLEVVFPQVPQLVQTVLIILAAAAAVVLDTTAAAAAAAAPRPCLVIKDTQVAVVVSELAALVVILQVLPLHISVAAAVPVLVEQAMPAVRFRTAQPVTEMLRLHPLQSAQQRPVMKAMATPASHLI